MTWWNAFFCVMAAVGIFGSAYLAGAFLEIHFRHRRIARSRRWPREQHRSYFSDCRRVPEDDIP